MRLSLWFSSSRLIIDWCQDKYFMGFKSSTKHATRRRMAFGRGSPQVFKLMASSHQWQDFIRGCCQDWLKF
jgi:hypothetical protein